MSKHPEKFNEAGRYYTRTERRKAYEAAYHEGRAVAETVFAEQR